MKPGYVLMRYGLDEAGNEISGVALCASTSRSKIQARLREVGEIEEREGDSRISYYTDQTVVKYNEHYEDENGVRYIIEYIDIL